MIRGMEVKEAMGLGDTEGTLALAGHLHWIISVIFLTLRFYVLASGSPDTSQLIGYVLVTTSI